MKSTSRQRKTFTIASVMAWMVLAICPGDVRAEDDSNLIFNATTTNFGGGLIVGNTGTNNSLQIYNAGAVTNTAATIGSGAGASNNFVIVSDTGSIWSSTSLILGSGGGNNQMTISNAGLVNASSFFQMGFSSHNTLIVTGADSAFHTPGSFAVGEGGVNNRMIIAEGGKVSNADGYIGLIGETASNNTVVVSGGIWTNATTLSIGYASAHSRLVVTNGGQVYNGSISFLGGNAAANSNAANNSVLVSGSNSLWKSGLALNIGQFAGGNFLTVSNGGQVIVGGATRLGANAGSGTNTVMVTGAGSLWTNNGALEIGGASGGNSLSVSGTGQVIVAGTTFLGNSSGGNSLSISSGGLFVGVGSTTVGRLAGSDGNTVLVTGAGSVWSNASSITLGNSGGGGNNQMTISNGGRVVASFFANNTANNTLTVTGTNSLFHTPGSFVIGNAGTNNLMTIADGGKVSNADGYIGLGGVADSNSTVVVNGGVWTNTSTLDIGYSSPHNRMIVTNGGKVYDNGGSLSFIGGNAAANANAGNNSVLLSDSNSLWRSNGGMRLGKNAGGNSLIVSNGANLIVVGNSVVGVTGAASGSNTIWVTGAGSIWTNTTHLIIGQAGGGGNNQLTIADGGRVDASFLQLGFTGDNSLTVTGSNSLFHTSGSLAIGEGGNNNSMTISNGGRVVNNDGYIGLVAGGSNDQVLITGAGSIWQNGSSLIVGSNATTKGIHSRLLVTDGGTLEATSFTSGFNGTGSISNRQGIYQFAIASPTITPNTADSIVITNGTISYRNVSAANIFNSQIANMKFHGDNAFRLNNSTNSSVAAYTFDSVANTGTPTNYQALALVNGGSRWVGSTLTIGTGGALLVSNAANATVAAAVNSLGSIKVVDSKVTWASNVVVYGDYVSDPSTNAFAADLTINPSGFAAGGPGDLFDFQKNFNIHSTNNAQFDLIQSTVQFSGGGVHTNLITGKDYGTNGVYGGNFEYGTLRLASTNDIVCFGCGTIPASASNALYVGWLDLTGLTNDIPNVTTLVTSLLFAPTNINLYYASFDTRNDYLGGLTYQLLDCEGNTGGLLMAAIPEPTLLALAGLGELLLRRRRNG